MSKSKVAERRIGTKTPSKNPVEEVEALIDGGLEKEPELTLGFPGVVQIFNGDPSDGEVSEEIGFIAPNDAKERAVFITKLNQLIDFYCS